MKRITAIDTLKGLMLVIIMSDHLGGPLKFYTWESFGFITATEGFVLLAGILTGIVYRHRIEHHRPLFKNLFKRIVILYKYTIVPVLALAFIFRLFPPNVGYAYYWKTWLWMFIEHPMQALWQSMTLQYQPGYFDLLSLYLIFSLLTPILLFAFKRGWGKWVLAASFGLWVYAQFDVPWLHALWHGAFDRAAWQLLFVCGSYLGYHHRSTHQRIAHTPRWKLFALTTAALTFFAIRHAILPTPVFITDASIDRIFLGWARVLNFSIVAYLIAWLAIRFPQIFNIKWLALLGRHSLQVFTYSSVLVYFAQPIYPRVEIWGENWLILIVLAAVISLTLPALVHEWYLQHRGEITIQAKVFAGGILRKWESEPVWD